MNTADSIEIMPAKTPRSLMVYFAFLGVAVLVGTRLILHRLPDFPQAWLVSAWSVAMFLGFAVACLVLYVLFTREQARGPILLIHFGKKEARLPRAGRSWPIDKVVRFDIVSGRCVRRKGRSDKPVKLANPILELQMVVDDAGEMVAWPLIAQPAGKTELCAAWPKVWVSGWACLSRWLTRINSRRVALPACPTVTWNRRNDSLFGLTSGTPRPSRFTDSHKQWPPTLTIKN